jgi:hypothetical protein
MRKLHTLAALAAISAISALPVLAENVQYRSNPQNLSAIVNGQGAPAGEGATATDIYRGYTKSSELGSPFEGTATTVPGPTEQAQGVTSSLYRGYAKSIESVSSAFEGTAITVPASRSLLDESTEIAKEKLDRAGM